MLAVFVLYTLVWMVFTTQKCFFMFVKFCLSTSLISRNTEQMEITFCTGVSAQKDLKFNETEVSQTTKNLYIMCD